MTVNTDIAWVEETPGKILKQARWVVVLFSIIMFLSGGWGISANAGGVSPVEMNLTGEWEIQEEDRAYQATLDAKGNGWYSWQEGRIQTEKVADRLWSGTWHQKGNDREGGFEVLLSKDGQTAEGVWWYLRVGTQKNIPPREWGGSYKFKRLSPDSHNGMAP